MAVAAAIGVGEDPSSGSDDVMSQRLANATARLSGKKSLLKSPRSTLELTRSPARSTQTTSSNNAVSQQQPGLSEINRSIEKMTLQNLNNGEAAGNHNKTMSGNKARSKRL